jgi:PAS domain S-box-containing protein
MHELVLATRYLNDVLFLALGLVALAHWRRRKDEAAGWVAATFMALGLVIAVSVFLPTDVDGAPMLWLQKLLILVLVLFPYLLYRFASTFERPNPAIDRWAQVSTAAVLLGSLALPRVPGPEEPRPGWFGAYVALVIVQWTSLSLVVAVRLWRGGRGQPTLTRRRMRTLCLASVLLNVGLILSGTQSNAGTDSTTALVVNLLAMASAALFFVGFAPPALLRLAWRRPEEQALHAAQLQLMAATTPAAVVDQLLPRMTDMLGGRGAALVDSVGRIVGSHGAVPDGLGPGDVGDGPAPVRLELESGTLLIWTSPHTPFFGREELGLLTSFGVVADLAIARCELLERQRESAARLEEAQQIAHIGGWQWDVDADRVTWSDEHFRIYGLEPQAFQPTVATFVERVPSDDAARVAASIRQAQVDHAPFSFDHRLVRPDGTERVLHVQGKVDLDDQGRARRLIGTAQDITERKAIEDALVVAYGHEREARMAFERTNGELESFVYSVSHDLKSPMISLLGYLDYLKLDFGSSLPEEAHHYIDRMSASGAYMQALIQDLLELSRIGRSATEREPVDLASVVGDILGEVSAAHPGTSVECGPLPVLSINPLRARQLLTNLIGNAVDHGERPDVHVAVAAELQADGSVVVSVADDGPGIPAMYRERVFGVFERLSARDRTDSGTGIGLAICRKIMDSLGGSIWVAESTAGATICASFPATMVEQAPATRGTRVGATS